MRSPARDSMSPASPSAISCPICGKPAVERLRPFCSKRCADIDLGNWLKGQYAIPAARQDDEDEERPEVPEGGGGKPH